MRSSLAAPNTRSCLTSSRSLNSRSRRSGSGRLAVSRTEGQENPCAIPHSTGIDLPSRSSRSTTTMNTVDRSITRVRPRPAAEVRLHPSLRFESIWRMGADPAPLARWPAGPLAIARKPRSFRRRRAGFVRLAVSVADGHSNDQLTRRQPPSRARQSIRPSAASFVPPFLVFRRELLQLRAVPPGEGSGHRIRPGMRRRATEQLEQPPAHDLDAPRRAGRSPGELHPRRRCSRRCRASRPG